MVDVPQTVRSKDAQSNLDAFIRRARNEVAAFGADLDFDAPVWDVTADSSIRVSSSKNVKRLYFTTHEGGTSKSMDARAPMNNPFNAFVKAMVRYRQEIKAKTADNHAVLIRAGRYLHDVLADRGYDPCRLMLADFNLAIEACRAREAESSQYRIGLFLAEIAETLNRHAIGYVQLDFKNPFPRVVHDHTRIGAEFEKRRSEKLPDSEELEALSEIANLVVEPADVVRMRAIELLVCGGWRINELLTLPVDAEVAEEAYQDGQPVLNDAGNAVTRYGIRYWNEKLGDWRVKWLPTTMMDVAKRAIHDIRQHTEAARDLARIQESLAESKATPKNSPIKSSQHLFLVFGNFFHSRRLTDYNRYEHVTDGQISDFLQGRVTGRGSVLSVFERFGFKMPDGSPMKITSHQFRHWLNTLQQRGGMGQHEIAKWFGRSAVGQNASYDHVSAMELAERARGMMTAGRMKGAIAEIHDRLPPVDRATFRESVLNTMHPTEIGGCVNDWSVAPCPIHGECGKCNELLVEKGNAEQRASTEKLLEENEWLSERATVEVGDGTYGASNHLEHIKLVVQGLRKAIAIHDDPSIPDGTLVQLNGSLPEIYSNRPLSSDLNV